MQTTSLLTQVELQVMNVLWDLGEGSVRDVMAALAPSRKLAYTSVATMLKILDQKGYVVSRKEGRRFLFAPTIERPNYQARNLQQLVGRLFNGSPLSLVRQLINGTEVSSDDLREMRQLLEEHLDE